MTLPASGPISISNINVELGYSSTRQTSLNEEYVRRLLGVYPTGTPSLQLAYGKQVGGSAEYTSPGTYTFNVPLYNTLTVTVKGAGGGGGGAAGLTILTNEAGTYTFPSGGTGTSGTSSQFAASTPLIGNGGGGGAGGDSGSGVAPAGAAGTATGGTTNTTGGGSNGGAGGNGSYEDGGAGGDGGRAVRTYTRDAAGAPVVGASITVVVGTRGTGGNGGVGTNYTGPKGTNGTNGEVTISWS